MLPHKRKDMDSPVSLSAKEGTSTGASCEEVIEVIQDELLKLEERAASSAGKLTEAEAKNNSRVVQIVCLNIRSLFLNSGNGGGTCEKNTAGYVGRYQQCCHERRDRNRTAVCCGRKSVWNKPPKSASTRDHASSTARLPRNISYFPYSPASKLRSKSQVRPGFCLELVPQGLRPYHSRQEPERILQQKVFPLCWQVETLGMPMTYNS